MGTVMLAAASTEGSARRLWRSEDWNRDLGVMRTHAVAASVAAASGRLGLLDDVLRSARAARISRAPLEEALLQVYLFAGYPRAIEALGLMAKSWPKERRPNRPRNEPATSASKERWRTQGERLCRRVYGKNFEKLHANVREAHPDLADWMIWEGYGKVLSRPGLDGMTRELCTTAALAALDAPRQLRAHVRGALNLGARVTQIRSAVRLAALGCGKRQWQRAATSVEGWLDDGDQP